MSLLWVKASAPSIDITHEPGTGGGHYRAYDYDDANERPVAYLRYVHTSPDTVGVDMIHTRPGRRREGLASALLDRLREDHPDKPVVTEDMSSSGSKFNAGYIRSRGEGMTALDPGAWWGHGPDEDWESEAEE